MDQDLLVDRVVHGARFGMLYRLPIALSTVNASTDLAEAEGLAPTVLICGLPMRELLADPGDVEDDDFAGAIVY